MHSNQRKNNAKKSYIGSSVRAKARNFGKNDKKHQNLTSFSKYLGYVLWDLIASEFFILVACWQKKNVWNPCATFWIPAKGLKSINVV